MYRLSGAEILYLFSAFHGVFLATLLTISKKRIRANIFLSLLIILFSFYLLENVVYSSGYLTEYPHFFLTTFPLIFLIGPLFYFYIRSNVRPHFSLRWADLVHLIPFTFEVIILLPFYTLDATIKLQIYEVALTNTRPIEFNIFFAGYLVYLGSTFWYFFGSFRLLSTVDPAQNSKRKLKRKWLRWFSMAFFTYIMLSSLLTGAAFFNTGVQNYTFHVNLILQTLLIHGIGYVAFLYPEIFKDVDAGQSRKYQSSALNNQVIANLKIKLLTLIDQEQPYLNSDVTPEFFADKLEISKHQFSQLLTEGMGTSFYDLINTYRVEKAKQLIELPEYGEAKILHIAYDSGFSNKSSFLRNFKKITGLTPTEYRSKSINKVPLH